MKRIKIDDKQYDYIGRSVLLALLFVNIIEYISLSQSVILGIIYWRIIKYGNTIIFTRKKQD